MIAQASRTRMRLRVLEPAQVHGNVSAVCRDLGISP
jgi:hypothetical protein